MVEAVAMAALKGFRKTHGSEIRVSPYYMDRRISSPTFGIRVTMTYKRAHFLLEAFTGNETPLVMETAVIDDASFHTCDNVMNRSGISTT
jgi:hypothetical protein